MPAEQRSGVVAAAGAAREDAARIARFEGIAAAATVTARARDSARREAR